MQLTNKVALITGAGSGLGRATAFLLAKEGAKIAAINHTQNENQETIKKIRQNGSEAISTISDISQPDQMQQAFQKSETRLVELIRKNPFNGQ